MRTVDPFDVCRRKRFFGLDVARDYYIGAALFVLIPLLVLQFFSTVFFSEPAYRLLAYAYVPHAFFFCCVLVIAVEILLFLVMSVDPGFVREGEGSPLAHTCRICRLSVEEFDHHCGFLGACVGRNTMQYFLALLLAVLLMCVTGLVFTLTFLLAAIREVGLLDVLLDRPLGMPRLLWNRWLFSISKMSACFLLPILFFGFIFSCVLGIWYINLCASGRYSYQRRRSGNPYNGRFFDVFHSFFSPHFSDTRHLQRGGGELVDL